MTKPKWVKLTKEEYETLIKTEYGEEGRLLRWFYLSSGVILLFLGMISNYFDIYRLGSILGLTGVALFFIFMILQDDSVVYYHLVEA